MNIRELKSTDVNVIREIHDKYFKTEFELPDFFDKFLCAFVVTDSNDIIISSGGVRLIPESILITNKDFSVRTRREALYRILDASVYVTKNHGYSQLHAFIQDDIWKQQLKKIGFNSCKGDAIYIDV